MRISIIEKHILLFYLLLVAPLAGLLAPPCALSEENQKSIEISGIGLEESGADSWVILRINRSPDEVFLQGDTIPEIGLVSKISKGCVEINNEHQSRSICIKGQKSLDANAESGGRGKEIFGAPVKRAQTDRLGEEAMFKLMTTSEGWLGKKGMGNATYDKSGEANGFLLTNIEKGSFLSLLGFDKSDLIKSVNGLPISNPSDLVRSSSRISDEALEIGFVRGGIHQSIAIRVNEDVLKLLPRKGKKAF